MTRYFYGSIVVATILSAVSKNELADKCSIDINRKDPIVESKYYYS